MARTNRRRFNAKKDRTIGLNNARDLKMAGEEGREIHDIESRAPRRSCVPDGDDFVCEKPKRTRSVQIGVVRGGKLSRTDAAGRVTVASDHFRKPSSVPWSAFRATLGRVRENAKKGTVLHTRRTRAEAREYEVANLKDYLEEHLFFSVTVRWCGNKGQRQRKSYVKNLRRSLTTSTDCIIVPDDGPFPTVIFPWRIFKLPSSTSDPSFSWVESFTPELHEVRVRREERAPAPASPIPGSYLGGSVDRGGLGFDFFGDMSSFFELFGDVVGSELIDALKEYGPALLSALPECYALSCVDPEFRAQYVLSRVSSFMVMSPSGRATALKLFTTLVSCSAVTAVMSALATKPESTWQFKLLGFSDLAAKFTEAFSTVRDSVSHGTVVSAMLAVVAALWALKNVESVTSEIIPTLCSLMTRSVGVASFGSITDIIKTLVDAVPVVITAVATAITTRSLAPLLHRKPGLFEEYVVIKTAHDLHLTGSYPNHLFQTHKEYVQAVSALERKFADAVATKFPPREVVQHRATVAQMYSEAVNSLAGKFRAAPFSWCLTGGSGIAKSSLNKWLYERCYQAIHGAKLSPDEVYTHISGSKFAAGLSNHTRVAVLDDLAQCKASQGVSISNPTQDIIDIINNVMSPSNQADLPRKGKVFWLVDLVGITTNIPTLTSELHSNAPEAILRRVAWFISVKVKPEFVEEGGVSIDKSKFPPPSEVPIPDMWTCVVYRHAPCPTSVSTSGHRVIRAPGCPPEGWDIYQTLEFMEKESKRHFDHQNTLVQAHANQDHAAMSVEDLRNASRAFQGPLPAAPAAPASLDTVSDAQSEDGVEEEKSGGLIQESEEEGAAIPSCAYLGFPSFGELGRYVGLPAPGLPRRTTVAAGALAAAALAAGYHGKRVSAVGLGVASYCTLTVARRVRAARENLVSAARKAGAGIAAVTAFVAWLIFRRPRAPAALPLGIAEFNQPQDEIVGPRPTIIQASSTIEGLHNTIGRALRVCVFKSGTASSFAVVLPLMTGFAVCNYHTIAPILDEARRTGQFTATLTSANDKHSTTHTMSIDDLWCPDPLSKDLAFLRFKGKSEADIRDYFMTEEWDRAIGAAGSIPASESRVTVARTDLRTKAQVTSAVGNVNIVSVQTHGRPRKRLVSFPDGERIMIALDHLAPAVNGDCGSALVMSVSNAGSNGTFAAGILSGISQLGDQSKLIFEPLTREMIATAVNALSSVRPLGHDVFGVAEHLVLSERLHSGLPLSAPGVRALGSLVARDGPERGRNNKSVCTFVSQLSYSRFEGTYLDTYLGPLKHCIPARPRDASHFANCLARMAKHGHEVPPDVLQAAQDDLTAQWEQRIGSTPVKLKPLSLFEAFNGSREIKSFPLNTSAGPGMKGKKRDHVEEACTLDCDDLQCLRMHPAATDFLCPGRVNYMPNPGFLRGIKAMDTKLREDPSGAAVFAANLKDEPIDILKRKIRVFFVGMSAFNVAVRRWLSPLFVMLNGDPAASECSVGIDVMSNDWETLMRDLEAYNERRRLAGDYSNYDNSIPLELVRRIFLVLVAVARAAGWSDDDVLMVQNIGVALQNPTYDVLGAIFLVEGTNPSGVSVTSFLNSAYNSFIHRVAFYTKNPELRASAFVLSRRSDPPFRDSVALRTYGDDVLGAVRHVTEFRSRAITNFDVRDAALLLEMTYGAADKGGILPETYDKDVVSYLKCTSVFCPSIGRSVGKLALSSIRKSLAFQRNGGLDAAINTANSALRLFYAHCDSDEGRVRFAGLREELISRLAEPDAVNRETLLVTFQDLTTSLSTGDAAAPTFPDECEARWL